MKKDDSRCWGESAGTMRRAIWILLAISLVTGSSASLMAQAHVTSIQISKINPTANGTCGLTLYRPKGIGACNVPISCSTKESNTTCGTGPLTCDANTTPAQKAAAFAVALNINCADEGITVTANGDVLAIASPSPNIECCIYSDEIGNPLFSGELDGLNVGITHQGVCTVQNICDGQDGNESDMHVGGFAFTKAEINHVCRRVSRGRSLAAGATETLTASCMSSEMAVGGGFSLGSNSLVIHSSRPAPLLDGWEGVVENIDNSNPHGFDVFAVCCPAVTCRRVAVGKALAASATATETATCMSGETAVGGGFSLGSNSLVIHSSRPALLLNGWEGVVENIDNSNPHGFDVFAACPASCRRVAVGNALAPGATATETATCMSGETAVGGGFSLGSNSLVIHSSRPALLLNGWEGVVENIDNNNPHGFDVFAVCCIEPLPVDLQSFSVD